MRPTSPLLRLALLGAALLLLGCADDPVAPSTSSGRAVYGVDGSNRLVRFSLSEPSRALRTVVIGGLQVGDAVVGIDFRPADSLLYAITESGRFYTVDTLTGGATFVSGPITPAPSGTSFGTDFNPVADRLRLHGDGGQNLRIDPDDGSTNEDSTLAYVGGDPNFGTDPVVAATAYTNSVPGAGSTTLYAIDTGLDLLVTLNAPNGGRLTTVGPLGVDAGGQAGFDIDPRDGFAYVALATATPQIYLYRIDLATGDVTQVGPIAAASPLVGIAIAP